jgi:hypothetical protein
MLTPNQYEVIGRIAVPYGELEFLMHFYALHLEHFALERKAAMFDYADLVPKPSQKVWLFKEKAGFFKEKLRRLRNVLDRIGTRHSSLKGSTESVSDLLQQIEEFANDRNRIIHGVVCIEPSTQRLLIEHYTGSQGWDQEKLERLADRGAELRERLADECGQVLMDLSDVQANPNSRGHLENNWAATGNR